MEIVPELAKLGVFGMHLRGYGAAGMSNVMYGLACQELERGDSGLRSFVSVQGSLCMFPIHRYGSEEQKQTWLPKMAAGEVIGCFGLTEPEFGSNPAGMATRARRDGDDWVINGSKRWITNGNVAKLAIVWARTDQAIRGFLVEKGMKGFEAREIHHKLSMRASVTLELLLDYVRVPACNQLPEAQGWKAPLSCLNEARYGVVWVVLGAAVACHRRGDHRTSGVQVTPNIGRHGSSLRIWISARRRSSQDFRSRTNRIERAGLPRRILISSPFSR